MVVGATVPPALLHYPLNCAPTTLQLHCLLPRSCMPALRTLRLATGHTPMSQRSYRCTWVMEIFSVSLSPAATQRRGQGRAGQDGTELRHQSGGSMYPAGLW